jgi:FkbM family methyltransferase
MSPKKRLLHLVQQIKKNGFTKSIKILEAGISTRVPEICKVQTAFGNIYVLKNDSLYKRLLAADAYESHFVQLVQLILMDNDHVIDLGANVGLHTIAMAKTVNKGSVIAFEPLSLIFPLLQLSLIENKIHNVQAYKLAVSDATGCVLEMESIPFNLDSYNVGRSRISSSGIGDVVLSVCLDDIDLPKIAFIKIDIQGYEHIALRGMKELLYRDRPLLFIEIEEYYLEKAGTSSKLLIEYLFSLGYVLYRIKSKYPCDHFAVPRERVVEIETNFLPKLIFPVDKLEGTYIDLIFNSSAYVYSEYKVS